MTEFPRLPEHYVQRTIADIGPEEPYYLKTEENLVVDRNTLQPFLSKYTSVTAYEKSPSSLNGRFGIMRIMGETAGKLIDGYIIDMRFVDDHEVLQDDILPHQDDTYEITKQKEEDNKDLLSPIGIVIADAETSEEILLGHVSVRSYLFQLCEKSDEIHQKIANRSDAKRRPRPAPPHAPSSNSPASSQIKKD